MTSPSPSPSSNLFQKIQSNKLYLLFVGGTSRLSLLSRELHPITLKFSNADLERHYYAFFNDDMAFYVTLCVIICAVMFLVYIPLDFSYTRFSDLLISRIVSAAFLFTFLLLIIFVRSFRRHVVHFLSFALVFVIVSSVFVSLYLRNEIGFSPLFMLLLWGNTHFAAFTWLRTITGMLLIISQALVWIFYFDRDWVEHMRNQTLSYILFYVGTVIAAYSRELSNRRVYLQLHEILNSEKSELKNYTTMLSSSTRSMNRSTKSTHFSSPPLHHSSSNRSSVAFLSPSPSTSSIQSSPSFKSPTSLSSSIEIPLEDLPSESVLASPSFDTLLARSPAADFIPSQPGSNAYAAMQDVFSRVADKVRRIFDGLLPNRGDDVLVLDIGHHRTAYLYVSKLSHRFTLRFRDSLREARFAAWHLADTAQTVRRFILLNIVSIVAMVVHDLDVPLLSDSERSVLFILRFGVIILSLLVCFVIALWPRDVKWRGFAITALEAICAATSLAMGLYAYAVLEPKIGRKAELHYDLYFGYVVRFLVYGFVAMGQLWMQSTITATIILIIMYATTIYTGVPLALTPLLIIVAGFTISFTDEKSRRVEFYLTTYKEELVTYIRAKEHIENEKTEKLKGVTIQSMPSLASVGSVMSVASADSVASMASDVQ